MALSILHQARGNCTTFCYRKRALVLQRVTRKIYSLIKVPNGESDFKSHLECVVKGYHQCPFDTSEGDTFIALKKIGERGRAFRVINAEGNQLGHLQKEVFPILWTLEEGAEISW